MRVFFLTRKMAVIGLVVMAAAGFLLWSFLYGNFTGVASPVKNPIYQGVSGQKAVAITVNVDWGEDFIPAMLEEFKKQQALVTFFVTGTWAEKNGELLKQMAQAGHSIQNHGYKHVHFNSLSHEQCIEQIKKAEAVIESITGKKTTLFASPYGEQNKKILSAVDEIHYELIMWSIDTIDWQRPSPDTIVKRVCNQVHDDAIILMHPTEPTVKALPQLLEDLKQQGYNMVGLEQILVRQDSNV